MIRDVHISGSIDDRHEFFTTVVGPDISLRLLHDGSAAPGKSYERFFSAGNELLLTPDGVGHIGTGGSFCSYMFGVDVPDKDLLRREVRNRLVMHGARYDEEGDKLVFSNDTAGFDPYSRLFSDGHAFANYYFFVAGETQGSLRAVQEVILRLSGKFLKRHDLHTSARDGRDLAVALHEACAVRSWTLFLVKVVDVNAEAYYQRYRQAYSAARLVGEQEQRTFDLLARHYRLDAYRQERIHLDVVYEQEDNKRIVDAYKEALAPRLGAADDAGLASKLNLLRALAARNRIPAAIFDHLDTVRAAATRSPKAGDPPFVADARALIEEIFVSRVGGDLDNEEVVRLLCGKRAAVDARYVGFEAVLLDAGRAAEEWRRVGEGARMRSHFELIVFYLDLFDTAAAATSSIAFLDDAELTPARLEEMLEARQAFEELRTGLFGELFVEPLERHNYLTLYGRRRVDALERGLRAVDADPRRAAELASSIHKLNETARMHRLIEQMLRGAVGNIYDEPLDAEQKEALREDVENRLRSDYGVTAAVGDRLFDEVLLGIEEEYFYATKLLPSIVATRDLKMRDSFLRSSGLDRFRVEELEAAYLQRLAGEGGIDRDAAEESRRATAGSEG